KRQKVFVLGGHPEEQAELESALARLYVGAEFKVLSPSMSFTPDGPEAELAVAAVNVWRPDLVFCCLGMPKQEKWALGHRARLRTKLVLCVGAAMEFALGRVRRAPPIVGRIGLEWAWRLASDPKRLWRRYLVDDPEFAWLFAREWWRGRRERTRAS